MAMGGSKVFPSHGVVLGHGGVFSHRGILGGGGLAIVLSFKEGFWPWLGGSLQSTS